MFFYTALTKHNVSRKVNNTRSFYGLCAKKEVLQFPFIFVFISEIKECKTYIAVQPIKHFGSKKKRTYNKIFPWQFVWYRFAMWAVNAKPEKV